MKSDLVLPGTNGDAASHATERAGVRAGSEMWERAGYPLLVLLAALVAVSPAFGDGYWWGAHDARHSVYFLFEFDQAIRDGVLWPRWAPHFAFGYGYPFFNIYGPLTAYVGETIHLLGADLVTAVKGTFVLGTLLSGLAMYGFARRLFGGSGALLASVAYLFFPYHIADLYIRAALAESWAFVFLPLVFWGFFECIQEPRPRTIALTAGSYALFFLAHNGLAMQATFALIAWIVFWLLLPLKTGATWFWRDRAELRRRVIGAASAFVAALLGILLGSVFILPWLLETSFVNTDQWLTGYFSFEKHFVELWQLFSPYWGFGVSESGPGDTFPFQLGLVSLLFALAAWVFLLPDPRARYIRLFFTGMALFYVFLMLDASRFLWESPLGALVLRPMQFPWRFLLFAGFALAVLSGILGSRAPRGAALLLAALLVTGSFEYVRADIMPPAEGPVSVASLMRFQQSAGEMTGQSACVEEIPGWSPLADLWVAGQKVDSRFDYSLVPTAGNALSNSYQESTEVRLDAPTMVRWMITYYPGWHVYRLPLQGDTILEELPIMPQPGSCHIMVEAPAGHYRLLVRFEDTPVRVVGRWLSTGALGIVGLLLVWDRRRIFSWRT